MTQFYLYIHSRPDGSAFYVGKGNAARTRDFRSYRNEHYLNIIAKYGVQNIKVEIFPCLSEKHALQSERKCIAMMRENGVKLCNQTDGGEGVSGYKHTISTKLLMSLQRLNPSDETRSKWSVARTGKSYPNRKPRPPVSTETRAKQSASMKGKPSKRKGHPGTKHTEDWKQKVQSKWTDEMREAARQRAIALNIRRWGK